MTKKECELIVEKPSYWICTKCGWFGPDKSGHSDQCPYSVMECAHTERRLARAYMAAMECLELHHPETDNLLCDKCANAADLLREYRKP